MFLDSLKTVLTQAMVLTFNETYPVEEYQGLYFSIEYPVDRAAYPGVWVDFDPSDQLVNVGIGHAEYEEVDGAFNKYNRWEFRGHATYTIVALSSLERDRIFDELVRVIAFGLLEPQRSVFRQTIDSNQFIAAIMNYDNIEVGGSSANPGTPWDSSEIIYEITLSMGCRGEFVSDPATNTLIPISAFVIEPTVEGPSYWAPQPEVLN